MKLFSTRGRAGRKSFWLTSLALAAVNAVADGIIALILFETVQTGDDGAIVHFGGGPIAVTVVAVVIQLLFIWALLALSIRRCHDHDRSGLFLLLGIVPVANSWLFVEQGFVPGVNGPNRFGPDPIIRWAPPAANPASYQPSQG